MNVSVNPVLHQILGSPGAFGQQTNLVPPGSAKEAAEKLAVGAGVKSIGKAVGDLFGGAKTPGSTIGSLAGGNRRSVLGYPFRAISRLTGLAGHKARRQVGKTIDKGTAEGLDGLYKQFRAAGVDAPNYLPGMGIGSPRAGSQLQHMVERGGDQQFMNAVRNADIRHPNGARFTEDSYKDYLASLANKQVGSAANPRSAAEAFQGSKARWYDYALPAGGVVGTGMAVGGGPEPEAMSNDRNENFLTRSMGGIGDWLQNSGGMEGLGNWVKEHPYLSAGGGAAGTAAIIALLMKLFGQQQQ